MLFCPKCGSILRPESKEKKKVMKCSCGYSSDSESVTLSDSTIKDVKDVDIVSEEKELDTLPTTKAECPKCHHKECYFWLVQTRASDEPETKFLKCVKCKHTFRDYS